MGEDLLENIGLANVPRREQVYEQLEQTLRTQEIPTHWLPTYQVYAIRTCSSAS